MNNDAHTLRNLSLDAFDHPSAGDTWERCTLAGASDARLVEAVVAAITPPKQTTSPSSFVLHAPLELLARAALLPRVEPGARDGARRLIAAIAVRYAHAGAEADPPHSAFADDEAALAALLQALRDGDGQGVDSAVCFLLPRVPLARLRAALVDELVPRLGAAAHAPILLAALPRVADRIAGVGGLLRAPLRTLAASPDRLTWHLQTHAAGGSAAGVDPARELFDALAAPLRLKSSSMIAATVLAVERSGDAARLLAGPLQTLSLLQGERVLLRVAALSMLQDDPAHAPYGWTHCLTLPQALLANADAATDPRAPVAVAATQVLAFRATLGKVTLVADAPFDTLADMPAGNRAGQFTTLATQAALHPDAHLAKYTLACFDAAERDPEAAPLFLAAAARLGVWWEARTKG